MIGNPHEFTPEGRLSLLLNRDRNSGSGAINPDIVNACYAYYEFEKARIAMRLAEANLAHNIRALEHKDYDSLFEGWNRV